METPVLQRKQLPRYRQTFQCTQPLLVFSGPAVQPSLQMFRAPLGYPGFQVSPTLPGYSGSQVLRGPQSLQRLEEAVAGVSVYTEEQELGKDTSKSASTGRRRTMWHWRQGLMWRSTKSEYSSRTTEQNIPGGGSSSNLARTTTEPELLSTAFEWAGSPACLPRPRCLLPLAIWRHWITCRCLGVVVELWGFGAPGPDAVTHRLHCLVLVPPVSISLSSPFHLPAKLVPSADCMGIYVFLNVCLCMMRVRVPTEASRRGVTGKCERLMWVPETKPVSSGKALNHWVTSPILFC